jgi:uncharacterized membrane protein YcaP (DUF421 family)
MLFDDVQGLARVVVAGVSAYAWLVIVLRLSGKRSLAKLTAFDFAVTVAFGSSLATISFPRKFHWRKERWGWVCSHYCSMPSRN